MASIAGDGIQISGKLIGGSWEWNQSLPQSLSVSAVSLHFHASSSRKRSVLTTPIGSSSISSITPPKTQTLLEEFDKFAKAPLSETSVSSAASEQPATTSKSSITVAIPPEVEPYADDIRRFVDAMVYKLKVHAKKGRWENLPIRKAMSLLLGETVELENAIHGGNSVEVLTEAADVANFGLIISAIAIERGK